MKREPTVRGLCSWLSSLRMMPCVASTSPPCRGMPAVWPARVRAPSPADRARVPRGVCELLCDGVREGAARASAPLRGHGQDRGRDGREDSRSRGPPRSRRRCAVLSRVHGLASARCRHRLILLLGCVGGERVTLSLRSSVGRCCRGLSCGQPCAPLGWRAPQTSSWLRRSQDAVSSPLLGVWFTDASLQSLLVFSAS